MKIKNQLLRIALLATLPRTLIAAPLGTGFTYQGHLNNNGAPANADYDFSFILYDAPTNGNMIGTAVYAIQVPVSNGVFTVTIDDFNEFGPSAFAGSARWLEIYTRTNNPISIGNNYVMLWPRQCITPAPQATFALTASNSVNASFAATVADGSVTGSKLAPGAVAWNNISGIPAGFADGVDNDTTYTAGTGLTLSGANNQFSVNFSGSGAANTAARSDHNHFGSSWTGSSSGYGLTLINSSTTGTAFYAQQGTGSGILAPFGYHTAVWAESSQGDAIYGASGSQFGTGVYGYGTSSSGANYGVYGQSDSPNGVGVFARGSGTTGTALKISNGAIRVAGAGVNTGTAAFVHVVSQASMSGFGDLSVIDNPYCNNDPNAMLMITPVWKLYGNDGSASPPVVAFYDDGTVGFTTNRWVIYPPNFNDTIAPGDRFNVLVIKQ